MSHGKYRLVLTTLALGISAGGVYAADTDGANDRTQQRIDQLEAQVQKLENAQAQSQADLTAAVAKVLKDTDQRSQLMSSMGSGAGYDPARGFYLGSEDGNFLFHPFALFQFRGVADYRTAHVNSGSDLVPDSGTSTQTGFDTRRMEVGFDGNIMSPNLRYYFQWRTDAYVNGLQDAYASYRIKGDDKAADQVWLQAGQFIDPVWHEGNVDDSELLAADRSLVDAFIGSGFASGGAAQERIQGFGVIYHGGMLRATGVLHDGAASQGTNFAHTTTILGGLPPENFGVSGRVEYQFTYAPPAWDEYQDFTALGNKNTLMVLGAGADYTEAGSNHLFAWTADAQFETTSGIGLYAAFLGQYVDLNNSPGLPALPPTGAYNSYGYLLQVSYAFNSHFEGFGRYDFTHLDDGLFSSSAANYLEHNIHELTAGVNYYMYGHRAKFTVDGTWLPNGSPADLPALGVLRNNGKSEFILRAQVQLQI